MQPDAYWILIDGIPNGPHSLVEIRARVRESSVLRESLICRLGTSHWFPFQQLETNVPTPSSGPAQPGVPLPLPAVPSAPPAPQPPVVTAPFSPSVAPFARSRAWDPAAIAWLGILFTPMWGSVMAVLNGRKLGLSKPWWIPLSIGFGYLIGESVCQSLFPSYWVDLALYLGSLILLWHLVLKEQMPGHEQDKQNPYLLRGRWLWPNVVGLPLAFLTIYGLVIEPLSPLEPRQVCERFVAARSVAGMKKYTTTSLYPALDVLTLQTSTDGKDDPFELIDESPAPPGIGGHFVGWRAISTDPGFSGPIIGAFHLVNWSGEWKIEDLFFL